MLVVVFMHRKKCVRAHHTMTQADNRHCAIRIIPLDVTLLMYALQWMPNWEDPLNISNRYHVLCTSEKLQGTVAVKDITIEIPTPIRDDVIYENSAFDESGEASNNSDDDEEQNLYENTKENATQNMVNLKYTYMVHNVDLFYCHTKQLCKKYSNSARFLCTKRCLFRVLEQTQLSPLLQTERL